MAAKFGQLHEFQHGAESIESYLERTQVYFRANDIAAGKRVDVLLTVIGPKTYSLLRNLFSPDLPSSKSYAEICEKLKEHFNPKPLTIAQRFHFHRRNQLPGEKIVDYVAELRRMAATCEFGDQLQTSLRDRIVCGLRNESMQRRLLTEPDLTLDKTLTIVQGMEAAEENAKSLRGSTTEAEVHKVESQTERGPGIGKPCYRCGKKNHPASKCRFVEATCHFCKKKGHIASVCRSRSKVSQSRSRPFTDSSSTKSRYPRTSTNYLEEADQIDNLDLYTVTARSSKPIIVQMSINGQHHEMEVDTGAAVSLVSESTLKSTFPKLQLHPSSIMLKTYTNEPVKVLGEVEVAVEYKEQQANLRLVVVPGNGPSLLGRNWLMKIRLDWSNIHAVKTATSLQEVLNNYKELFNGELGKVQSFQGKLLLRENAQPKFCKARAVPFSIKDAIGKELDRLESQGIVQKVDHSEWAAPIVPVPKKDGSYRLCGDYKLTINPALHVNQYPLPKAEDLFTVMAGGKKFSKLDISQAYSQVQLDEESAKCTTVNTHQGLYMYRRLPFGVASAPAIFQQLMDCTLQGIPNAICFIDDILVTGANDEDHMKNLEAVLKRLHEKGFKLKKSKCAFMQDSVEYLGHKIDAEGLHALPQKQKAVKDAPTPTNVQQLRSFLGLVNYYGKFIANLSTIVHPLNELLQKDRKWNWTSECAQAFRSAKEALVSSSVLVHYDPKLPITLAGDASAYGIGAVISHTMPDGTERPIAFASRTLSTSERNYAQLEKEALSLVYGVKKFHQYLFGRKFTLITDHKPLTAILGSKKGIPSLAAARLQRWAMLLASYQYEIRFKPTSQHGNADGLSRLPLDIGQTGDAPSSSFGTLDVHSMDTLPISYTQVELFTRRDVLLSKVLRYTKRGWPGEVSSSLKPFFNRRLELSVENGCLLWGTRVIIPKRLQEEILEDLHQSHPGVSRMKSIARSYFWWPSLDKQIEELASHCTSCQSLRHSPTAAPLHHWSWPLHPWQRIHIDLAGPFQGKMFCIIVDAHSKWPEVFELTTTTSDKIIAICRKLFAAYGLPNQLVSDNGPQFVSHEFETFLKLNGVKHLKSAPYHPATNGEAERFIQTFKKSMKASVHDGLTLQHRLQNFLLSYRSTPHATTKQSPAELFLKRSIRTRFDILRPDTAQMVADKQLSQVSNYKSLRQFAVGDSVLIRNYSSDRPKWTRGKVIKRLGPLNYLVKFPDGNTCKRHVDQLLHCASSDSEVDSNSTIDMELEFPTSSSSSVDTASDTTRETVPPPDRPRSYPSRNRHRPDWFHCSEFC